LIDLRRLRYFVAVAEELHFGRASRRLNMSQPPLSQQIRLLERELGVQLFERNNRHVKITGAGAALLAEARQLLASTERAVRVVRTTGSEPAGGLRVGFSEPLGTIVNALLLRRLADRYPAVTPSLHQMSTGAQVTAMQDGELDAGILWDAAGQTHGDRFKHLVLFTSPVRIIMSTKSELATRRALTFEQLATQQILIFQRKTNPGLYDAFVAALQSHGITREPLNVEAAAVAHWVAAGFGVSFTYRRRNGPMDPAIAVRPTREPLLSVDATLTWPEDNTLPALKGLVEVAREVLATNGLPIA
jgi:DNA-binding transcriptional LysR family regulator